MDNLDWAYVLIGLGLVLMAAELFLPTGGILFGVAMVVVFAGVAMVFSFGDPSMGFVALVGVCIALPVMGSMMLYIWPKTPLGRRLVRQVEEADGGGTVASMPVLQELDDLRGRYGRTLSPLRPAGIVDFDGRRIDAMSEGMLVAADQWVRCIDVKAGRVIVRAAERPNLERLESSEFDV